MSDAPHLPADTQRIGARSYKDYVLRNLVNCAEATIPGNLCITNKNVPDSTIIPMEATMGDLRLMARFIQETREAFPSAFSTPSASLREPNTAEATQ